MSALKRVFGFLAAAVILFAFTACDEKEKDVSADIDMNAVYEANLTANLLRIHSSISETVYGDNEIAYTSYADKDIYYYRMADGTEEIMSDDFSFQFDGENYYGMLLADNGYNTAYDNLHMSEYSMNEQVVWATEKNGIISLKTNLPTKYTAEMFGEDYEDGMYLEITYELEGKNYAVYKTATDVVYADGSRENAGRVEITYDAERPENAAALLNRAKPDNDVRTLTIVLDPNTENERVLTKTVRKGDIFGFVLPDGYVMYSDEDCTVPFDSELRRNAHVLAFAKIPQ